MAPRPKMAAVTYFTSERSSKDSCVFKFKAWYLRAPAALPSCCGSCRCSCPCEDQPPPPEVLFFTVKQWTILSSAFTFFGKISVPLAWNKPTNCTEREILLAQHCWVCMSSDQSGLLCLLIHLLSQKILRAWTPELPKLSLTEKQGLSSSGAKWVSF